MSKKRLLSFSFIFPIFYIIYMLFGTLLLKSSINSDDYLWHIKAGEWMLKNKTIPNTGILSWFGEDKPWVPHEWLSEIYFYITSNKIGMITGAFLYIGFSLFLLFGLLYIFNKDGIKKNLLFSFLWMTIGLFSVSVIVLARPHMLMLSIFAVLLFYCEKIRKDESFSYKEIITFLPIAILGVNWHGGFASFFYIIPTIYLFSSILPNIEIGRIQCKKGPYKKYLCLLGVGIGSFFFSPSPVKLLFNLFNFADNQTSYIAEWQPLSMSNGLVFLIVMLIMLFVFLVTEQKIDFTDICVLGALTVMTFVHVRFGTWLYIAGYFYIFKYIKKITFKDTEKLTFLLLLVVTIFTVSVNGFTIKYTIKQVLSDKAIQTVKNLKCERLYNDYNFGSELIYNDVSVFFDPRTDLYTGTSLQDTFDTLQSAPFKYKEYIDRYNFDGFITKANNNLDYYLSTHTDKYVCVYQDEICVVYSTKQ